MVSILWSASDSFNSAEMSVSSSSSSPIVTTFWALMSLATSVTSSIVGSTDGVDSGNITVEFVATAGASGNAAQAACNLRDGIHCGLVFVLFVGELGLVVAVFEELEHVGAVVEELEHVGAVVEELEPVVEELEPVVEELEAVVSR